MTSIARLARKARDRWRGVARTHRGGTAHTKYSAAETRRNGGEYAEAAHTSRVSLWREPPVLALVLKRFFSMNMDEATRVMLHVHQKGVGVCGIFTYEVAETKVNQVMDFARQNQHPLQCTLEKA